MASRNGQSLLEVLVATGIGAILITGALTIIAPTLKGSKTVSHTQVAVGLAKELREALHAYSEGDWHRVSSLSTSSAVTYYLNTTSSPFTVATGTEQIMVATTTYTRSFYLSDVYRDAGGQIAGSGSYDPSTKQVTIEYGWSSGPTSTMVTYLTRSRDMVVVQSDWSGGGGVTGPVTSTDSYFATSTGINYTTTTGSILIDL